MYYMPNKHYTSVVSSVSQEREQDISEPSTNYWNGELELQS